MDREDQQFRSLMHDVYSFPKNRYSQEQHALFSQILGDWWENTYRDDKLVLAGIQAFLSEIQRRVALEENMQDG